MFRKWLTRGELPLVATALVFLAAGAVHAQGPAGAPRGNSYGNFYGSAYRSGALGGYNPGVTTNYSPPARGYSSYYGGQPNTYSPSPLYPGYSNYPPNRTYGPFLSYYPYLGSGSAYSPDYGSYGEGGPPYPYGAPGMEPAIGTNAWYRARAAVPARSDTVATVEAQVPAGARLWFNGTETTSTGTVREFNTPALKPGHEYSYEVRAQWQENGREVTQAQKILVSAGADVRVMFPIPAKGP